MSNAVSHPLPVLQNLQDGEHAERFRRFYRRAGAQSGI